LTLLAWKIVINHAVSMVRNVQRLLNNLIFKKFYNAPKS
jgi:hypothetical protein